MWTQVNFFRVEVPGGHWKTMGNRFPSETESRGRLGEIAMEAKVITKAS